MLHVIHFGSSSVHLFSVIRNLGVWIECGLTLLMHITKVVSRCFATLRQLLSIQRSVSHESLTVLTVALLLT